MKNQEYENRVNPSLFDKLSNADLHYLLEHDKDKLTEAQVFDIQSRINRFEEEDIYDKSNDKTLTLNIPKKFNKAGYVDIIVLMLVTWATCLCGMAYIYAKLNIIG